MQLMSTGTFANPDWYHFLDTTNQAGLWRAIVYMTTIDINLNEEKMKLLQDEVAVQSAELGRQANAHDAEINNLRAQAVSQYANEPLLQRLLP